MRRGDIEEARKYLNLLDATLFYHSWARSKEEQLKGEETLSMEKRLPRKSDWEREHDILMSISDYPGVLSSLVAEYPENKQALDYLLCYYLLNENLNSFKIRSILIIKENLRLYPVCTRRLWYKSYLKARTRRWTVIRYLKMLSRITKITSIVNRVEKQRRNYENVIPPPIGTTLTIFIE